MVTKCFFHFLLAYLVAICGDSPLSCWRKSCYYFWSDCCRNTHPSPPPSLPRLHPLLGITPGDYSRNSWGGPVLTLASSFTRGDGRESWLSFSSKSRLDQAKYPNGPNVIPNAVRNLIWSSWQAKEADSQQSIYEEGIWSFTWRVSSSMVSW